MRFAKATAKRIRVSPKKAKLVADLIRGMEAKKAYLQLKYSKLKSARYMKETLKSAVANAKDQFNVEIENLKIKEVKIDEGPTMKRSRSKNRGGRTPMMKRTSHFSIVLSCES